MKCFTWLCSWAHCDCVTGWTTNHRWFFDLKISPVWVLKHDSWSGCSHKPIPGLTQLCCLATRCVHVDITGLARRDGDGGVCVCGCMFFYKPYQETLNHQKKKKKNSVIIPRIVDKEKGMKNAGAEGWVGAKRKDGERIRREAKKAE